MSDVKTLHGDEVAVFGDAEFAQLIDADVDSHSFRLLMQMGHQRLAVLKALWVHGAALDKSGFAVSVLRERAERLDPDVGNITAILTAPAMAVCVERTCKGKRTFRIQLVALPDRWCEMLMHPSATIESQPEDFGAPVPVTELPAEVAEVTVLTTPAPPSLPSAEVEQEVASAVATALLARVVEILNHGGSNGPEIAKMAADIRALEERLGQQVGYVDKLRRDLRAAQDEVSAAHVERDGLRERVRSAEYNLRVAMSGDAQRLIDEEVHRQVDRIMRAKPASDKAS